MLDSLSEELILEIVQILHEQELKDRHINLPSRSYVPYINPVSDGLERIDSVTSLASTSKKLRRISLPILFHTLSISYSSKDTPHYDQDMAAGLTALRNFPSNSAFVKCLIITFLESWGEDEWLFPSIEEDFLVQDVMPALSNLEELKFSMEPPPLTHRIIAACNEKPSFRFVHIWTSETPWVDLPDNVSLNKVLFGKMDFGINNVLSQQMEPYPVEWIKRGARTSKLIVYESDNREWLNCTFIGLRKLELHNPVLSHQFLARHPLLSRIKFWNGKKYTTGGTAEEMCLLQPFHSAMKVARDLGHLPVYRAYFERAELQSNWDVTDIVFVLMKAKDIESAPFIIRMVCENMPTLRSIQVEKRDDKEPILAKDFWKTSGLYLCHKIESVILDGFRFILEGEFDSMQVNDPVVLLREMIQSVPNHNTARSWKATWMGSYVKVKLEEQAALSTPL